MLKEGWRGEERTGRRLGQKDARMTYSGRGCFFFDLVNAFSLE